MYFCTVTVNSRVEILHIGSRLQSCQPCSVLNGFGKTEIIIIIVINQSCIALFSTRHIALYIKKKRKSTQKLYVIGSNLYIHTKIKKYSWKTYSE